MKINKSNFGWLFACIGLFLLLCFSVYLGISGFFFQTDIAYSNDLILGQVIDAKVKSNQASSISVNLSGGFLPGERLSQIVSVKNDEESDKLYLRAKVFIYTSQNDLQTIDVVENSNWTKKDDGYFYFNDLLKPQEKVNFCSEVIASSDFVMQSSKKYILTFIFETISESFDVESFWGTNPLENI